MIDKGFYRMYLAELKVPCDYRFRSVYIIFMTCLGCLLRLQELMLITGDVNFLVANQLCLTIIITLQRRPR